MAYNVWPPYIGGMLVGGLQLPLVVIMKETLGGSSSVSFVVGQLFFGPLEKLSPYGAKFRWHIEHYWQVLMFDTLLFPTLLLSTVGHQSRDVLSQAQHVHGKQP